MNLPLWASLLIGLGSPALTALAAVIVAIAVTRRSASQATAVAQRTASELEARSKREETGVNLRAALALACSVDEYQRRSGLAQLQALNASGILNREQRALVAAQLRASIDPTVAQIRQLGTGGEDVTVSKRPTSNTPGEED